MKQPNLWLIISGKISFSFEGKLSGLMILVIKTVHTNELTAVADINMPTILPFYRGNIVTMSNWILYWIEYSEKQIKNAIKNKNNQFVHIVQDKQKIHLINSIMKQPNLRFILFTKIGKKALLNIIPIVINIITDLTER